MDMRSLLHHKKAMLLNQGLSMESAYSGTEELESDSQSMTCSETGSLMTNPAFRQLPAKTERSGTDIRSVLSDSELDQNVSFVIRHPMIQSASPASSKISMTIESRDERTDGQYV